MFSFIDGIHRRAYRLYILFLAWLSKPERVRKTAELLANKKRRVYGTPLRVSVMTGTCHNTRRVRWR